MKYIQYILLVTLFSCLGACQKFEELETDTNRSTEVPPSLVLRGILKDMNNEPWTAEQRWNQYWASNYNYYDDNEYWTGPAALRYATLKNVAKMEEEALRLELPASNAYSALGKFFRAYFFYDMTMKVGDLPMREALQGDGNTTPRYDTQAEIFDQVLLWLDEANTDLAARIAAGDKSLQDDFYFNGDLSKWQKTVNAFRLRVLVQLSEKENEASLDVKQQFAAILGDPARYPLPASNDDNLSFRYSSIDKYPFNPDNFGFYALRYNTAATYINTLAGLNDPRVFVVAEPATAKLAAGYTAQDYEAYVGAPSDEGLDEMATKVQAGEYSLISKDYFFGSYQGEASVQIGYPEMCFNIAEGVLRGWASGNGNEWYTIGIEASMASYGISDPAVLSAYLAQPGVAMSDGAPASLEKVLVQKYLALAQHSGLESYYNWRRTGFPTFYQGGPGTGNSGLIPLRFQYPTSERDNNTANYLEALQRQFGNKDDSVNDELWVVK